MKKKKLALRLAQILVVLVGISFVTFLLTYLSPGDLSLIHISEPTRH